MTHFRVIPFKYIELKHIFNYGMILICICVSCMGCKKEHELPDINFKEIIHITTNSAIVYVDLSDWGNYDRAELVFSKEPGPDLNDSIAVTNFYGQYGNKQISVLKNLEPGTKYYARFYVSYAKDHKYSEGYTFTTHPKLSFIDERDGQVYEYVKIGNQTWMAQNLNYKTKSALYYNHDSILYSNLGLLYTGNEAQYASPKGWHLPSDAEWGELELYIGLSVDEIYNFFRKPNTFGYKLMSVSGDFWNFNINMTNETGFNAVGTGSYSISGDSFYSSKKSNTNYWSSSECKLDQVYTIGRAIIFTGDVKREYFDGSLNSYSVRCIKDK